MLSINFTFKIVAKLLCIYACHGNRNVLGWVPEFWGKQTLLELVHCLVYNRGGSGVSLYSAARKTHVVLIRKSVNNWPFSIIP